MTFQKKYEPEDFLSELSDVPQTTTNIAKKTGAGRSTLIRFLKDLETAGKVKRVEIEGGYHAWVKAENEIILEGIIPDDGCIQTGHAGKQYKLIIKESL